MGRRLDLQTILETIIPHVYFQPPTNVSLEYPCIIYHRDSAVSIFADDLAYRYTKRYQIIVVDRDPDSLLPDQIAILPLCTFDRFYTADNLNHDVFNLYF